MDWRQHRLNDLFGSMQFSFKVDMGNAPKGHCDIISFQGAILEMRKFGGLDVL